MVRLITDKDLQDPSLVNIAIEAVEMALDYRRNGTLTSPPRHPVAIGNAGGLVFTAGGLDGGAAPVAGFRAYTTFNSERDEQIVAVWDLHSGSLLGLFIGTRLGALRTGAIGGVAIRHMARTDARIVGVIGSGQQARSQLEAAACVREIELAYVYSRNQTNRLSFAHDMQERLGIPVVAVETARHAVEASDIIICATSSSVPVIEAAWLKPGAHINTIGPKSIDAHEIPVDVAISASFIATDSPEQMLAYPKPFFLTGTSAMQRVIDLARSIASGAMAHRQSEDITLFCSTGLAGTEVLVGTKILEQAVVGIEITP